MNSVLSPAFNNLSSQRRQRLSPDFSCKSLSFSHLSSSYLPNDHLNRSFKSSTLVYDHSVPPPPEPIGASTPKIGSKKCDQQQQQQQQSTHHQHHHHYQRPTIDLNTVLESFRCNISELQAWALFYQAMKTLNALIVQFDDDQSVSELALVKLNQFSDIVIDSNGSVLAITWTPSEFNDNSVAYCKCEDRKLLNELINSLLVSFTILIYQALEWRPENEEKRNNNNDDDEEPDLDVHFEHLMMTIIQCVDVNKSVVDEGYIDVQEDNYIAFVNEQCENHFQRCCYEQCDFQKSGNQLNADMYFGSVLKSMFDESIKLNSFGLAAVGMPVVDDHSLVTKKWKDVMKEFQTSELSLRHVKPEPEWKPVRAAKSALGQLMEQIKNTKKEHLRSVTKEPQRLSSRVSSHTPPMPTISEQMIVDRLKNLKPASERSLNQLPFSPPCLHERLMNEIRSKCVKLQPTETIVKPSIRELYISERRLRKNLSGTPLLSEASCCSKRKHMPGSLALLGSLTSNQSVDSIEDDDLCLEMNNELSRNFVSMQLTPKVRQQKKQRINFEQRDCDTKQPYPSTPIAISTLSQSLDSGPLFHAPSLSHSISYSSLFPIASNPDIRPKPVSLSRTRLLDIQSNVFLRRSFIRKPSIATETTVPSTTTPQSHNRNSSFRSSIANLWTKLVGGGSTAESKIKLNFSKLKEE